MSTTPKDKAKELVERFDAAIFTNPNPNTKRYAKACALICVEEIMNVADNIQSINYSQTKMYWKQVKTEIENL